MENDLKKEETSESTTTDAMADSLISGEAEEIEEYEEEVEPIRFTFVEKLLIPLMVVSSQYWVLTNDFSQAKNWIVKALHISDFIFLFCFVAMIATVMLGKKGSRLFRIMASNFGGMFLGFYVAVFILTCYAARSQALLPIASVVLISVVWYLFGRPEIYEEDEIPVTVTEKSATVIKEDARESLVKESSVVQIVDARTTPEETKE